MRSTAAGGLPLSAGGIRARLAPAKKEKCNGFRAAKGLHVFAAWPMRRKQNGLSPSSPWPTGWTERRGNAAPSGRQPEAQGMAYALRCRQPRARTRDGSPKGGDSLLAPCGAKRNTTARSAKGRCAKNKKGSPNRTTLKKYIGIFIIR